jgi:hypothetical protein
MSGEEVNILGAMRVQQHRMPGRAMASCFAIWWTPIRLTLHPNDTRLMRFLMALSLHLRG